MMPPYQNNSNKIVLTVLIVAILVILFNFNRALSMDHTFSEILTDIYDKKATLEDYKKFEETSKYVIKGFNDTFNGASSGITSTDGFLILEPNASDQFNVKRESSSDKCSYVLLSQCLADSNYSTRVCKDLKIETKDFNKNNEAPIKVTAGSQTGYNIIKFTNSNKNKSIYVLVLVAKQ